MNSQTCLIWLATFGKIVYSIFLSLHQAALMFSVPTWCCSGVECSAHCLPRRSWPFCPGCGSAAWPTCCFWMTAWRCPAFARTPVCQALCRRTGGDNSHDPVMYKKEPTPVRGDTTWYQSHCTPSNLSIYLSIHSSIHPSIKLFWLKLTHGLTAATISVSLMYSTLSMGRCSIVSCVTLHNAFSTYKQ